MVDSTFSGGGGRWTASNGRRRCRDPRTAAAVDADVHTPPAILCGDVTVFILRQHIGGIWHALMLLCGDYGLK